MDRTKAQKLVNNILSNAIKYSSLNSKIKVTLKNNIFSVQDYGIGISKEEHKEILSVIKEGKILKVVLV